MRLEGLRRWLAEILWPKLHELDVICEMNRVAADVVNGEWRKDRDGPSREVQGKEGDFPVLGNERYRATWNPDFI